MRAHFQGFREYYRLWVHLSQPKDLNWVTGADMKADLQGCR